MNYTPGPWKAVVDKSSLGTIVRAEVVGADGEWLTQLWDKFEDNFKGDEETIANINLISAAPDMLLILEELRACSYCWCDYEVPLGIVERMDEVLKKVRGNK